MTPIYLDHAASAMRHEEVFEAMAPYMHGVVGNPSGSHAAARAAKLALEDAREEIAAFLDAPPTGVIFTGGGTEANHLALWGTVHRHRRLHRTGTRAIAWEGEHKSVLDVMKAMQREWPDIEVLFAKTLPSGHVDVEHLLSLVSEETAVVSVMTANNETGIYQPLPEIFMNAKARVPYGTTTHTDAIAAARWLYLPFLAETADLLTICAQKLGGPVNSGALVMKNGVEIDPVTVGGGQEFGLRGGTVDVAAAVGLAAAVRIAARDRDEVSQRVADLATRLTNALAFLPGCRVTAAGQDRLENVVHVTFDNVVADELLFQLDQVGIYASAASSCASGATEPSHVLVGMGLEPARLRGALRFSLGPETTLAEIDETIAQTARIVHSLATS